MHKEVGSQKEESMIITESAPVMTTEAGDREEMFADLYERAFPQVAKFVSKRSGTLAEAKDIFQDALVIFWEMCQAEKTAFKVSEVAYVTGIAKHLWIRKYKTDQRLVPLNDFEQMLTIPEDYFPSGKQLKLLMFLENAGKKCMDLLSAFYYQASSLTEIRNRFGYSSIHSATVQKFKCLEKIRNHVKEKNLHYEDFTD